MANAQDRNNCRYRSGRIQWVCDMRNAYSKIQASRGGQDNITFVIQKGNCSFQNLLFGMAHAPRFFSRYYASCLCSLRSQEQVVTLH